MAELSNSHGLRALIQVQTNLPSRSAHPPADQRAAAAGSPGAEDQKAVDAAEKFESLMIHSMLKGMRRTTMSESTSNERALYDDMLDEKMADTLMQAGGLGVASQILSQLRNQPDAPSSKFSSSSLSTADTIRLRELAQDIGARIDVAQPVVSVSKQENIQDAAQRSQERQNFLAPLVPHARRTAQRLGTTPEAVLAIAALETGWGKSVIRDQSGADSNNLFGIKATSATEPSTRITTTEYVDGIAVKTEASFRVFDNTAHAVEGFGTFVLENPRYSAALQHAEDPERFLRELHKAGYATDPHYADKAISIMQQIEITGQPL